MPAVYSFPVGRRLQLESYPQESPQLNTAYEILQQFNSLGVMVSWSFTDNDWVVWDRYLTICSSVLSILTLLGRPIRVDARTGRGTPMSARSFPMAAQLQAPSCPHSDSGSTAMTLFLNQRLGNRCCDYYRCVSHRCRFTGE